MVVVVVAVVVVVPVEVVAPVIVVATFNPGTVQSLSHSVGIKEKYNTCPGYQYAQFKFRLVKLKYSNKLLCLVFMCS